MTDRSALSHHPAPCRDQLSTAKTAFVLYTGPLAWLLQLCAGLMLTSWPCFPATERLREPLAGYGWTLAGAIGVLIGGALLAAVAGWVSWRTLQATKQEREGGHRALADIGHGRTRFVALWGTILGAGFGLATLVTLVAFAMVPRCLG